MGEKIKAMKKTADGSPDYTEIIETHSRGNQEIPDFQDCRARSDTDDFKRFVLRSVQDAVFFKAVDRLIRKQEKESWTWKGSILKPRKHI